MQLSRLVLPAPLGPITAARSPGRTASETLLSTARPPKPSATCSTANRASAAPAVAPGPPRPHPPKVPVMFDPARDVPLLSPARAAPPAPRSQQRASTGLVEYLAACGRSRRPSPSSQDTAKAAPSSTHS